MTQEEKELLLKYLCMALPYGVKCHVPTYNCAMTLTGKRLNYFCFHKDEWGIDYSHEIETVLDPLNDQNNDYVVKPYLRPMSSMTDEEKEEMHNLLSPEGTAIYGCGGISMPMNHYGEFVSYEFMNRIIQYLLKNHFDFMGLIPKDLAIEVTENNNPYK